LRGSLSLPTRRWTLIGVVALLALSVASVTASAGAHSGHRAVATVAKKKCKKGKKSATAAKKKCKKKKKAVIPPAATTPPPAPLALTADEVVNRVIQKAGEYCSPDPNCVDYGYYYDAAPGDPECESRTTYSWSCYGWNEEDAAFDPPNAICDFREIVERDGYNGIKSHQDLSFGGVDPWAPGWDCYEIF
jgi:hypothetical protein